jgi:hypothetical protein
LSNKWRILQRPLNIGLYFALDTVKACVVLDYFVHQRDGYKFEGVMKVTGLEDAPDRQAVLWGLTANNLRNKIADYFLRDAGAFPCKYKKYEQ